MASDAGASAPGLPAPGPSDSGASDAAASGRVVEVWTDGVCAESLPVQCGIEAVRMRD